MAHIEAERIAIPEILIEILTNLESLIVKLPESSRNLAISVGKSGHAENNKLD